MSRWDHKSEKLHNLSHVTATPYNILGKRGHTHRGHELTGACTHPWKWDMG